MELKDSQYQAALKLLSSAEGALQQLMASMRRRDEPHTLRRLIEEVEGCLKKAKGALRLS
ncbi:MAG: hypothetical protein GTN64_03420 [Candidatus Latescibacteria bacterium]|nr:hypothetical protein [Candidatus Latescibacterota bacterium]NIO77662.1 hypothetical protein [Candidatus Latescibacterota bacterium]